MSDRNTEERLAVLEKEVAELKEQLARFRSSKDWFRRVSGSLKDEPEFARVLELGREIRQSEDTESED